jgi:hypothetical protein
MARKFEVDKINLDPYDIEPFENNSYKGFVIKWDSDIGFGEYTIYQKIGEDEWHADSEYMDANYDKSFIKELMKLFIEKLDVID